MVDGTGPVMMSQAKIRKSKDNLRKDGEKVCLLWERLSV